MYNYSIKTTYLNIDDNLQDTQYRKEYLSAFNLEEYNEKIIFETIDLLYNKFKNNKQIIELLKMNENNIFGLSQQDTFLLFFSFEKFYYFHKALQILDKNEVINKKLIKNLQKK